MYEYPPVNPAMDPSPQTITQELMVLSSSLEYVNLLIIRTADTADSAVSAIGVYMIVDTDLPPYPKSHALVCLCVAYCASEVQQGSVYSTCNR